MEEWLTNREDRELNGLNGYYGGNLRLDKVHQRNTSDAGAHSAGGRDLNRQEFQDQARICLYNVLNFFNAIIFLSTRS